MLHQDQGHLVLCGTLSTPERDVREMPATRSVWHVTRDSAGSRRVALKRSSYCHMFHFIRAVLHLIAGVC